MSRVAGAFLLLVLLTSVGSASDPSAAPDDRGPGAASAALAVSVSETPDAVLLRIQASGDVEPGSVEVQFADRETVVLARDAEGRPIRSQPVRLPELVVGDPAAAARCTSRYSSGRERVGTLLHLARLTSRER